MSMDLSEFLDVFFEECFEGLDAMESGLINLDSGSADEDEINRIFRAAHSIKGGAATFDMTDVSEFTHVMETLLDEMRDGRRAVSKSGVDLLLSSVDGLRSMCNAIRASEDVDHARINALKCDLEAMLAAPNPVTVGGPTPDTQVEGGAPPAADASDQQVVVEEAQAPSKGVQASSRASQEPGAGSGGEVGVQGLWTIRFVPQRQLFLSGNDPQHVFRALEELGSLDVEVDLGNLPTLKDLDPESSYLAWTLRLRTDASEESIREAFAWVEDECDLQMSCEPGPAPDAPAEPAAPEPASVPEQPETEVVAGTPEQGASAIPDDGEPEPEADLKPEPGPALPQGAARPPAADPTTVAKTASKPSGGGAEGSSIRVSIDKVDDLINLVGELVITQSMLSRFGDGVEDSQLEQLRDGLSALARNTRELQETAMQIRMLPISTSFNRFPRLVRDLSAKLEKKVELKISGGGTELDKTVLEKIGDPMVHLVRNSMDHGIESPAVRTAAGKQETGTLHLNAYHQGGNIVIEVIDDGAGLNTEKILSKAKERGVVAQDAELSAEQINNLIFQPGFSTADTVSDVSGRGVGMDVVRRNIQDLGGTVVVDSVPGSGSIFTIRLPLTLAILDGQLVRVGKETYIISLVSIVESLQVSREQVNVIAGRSEVYQLREKFIPVVRLHEVFNVSSDSTELEEGLLVVVESDGGRVGLFVDELLGQQQVVIKSLESNFRQIDTLSGATILGDGTVALILDIPGLVKRELDSRRNGAPRLVAA